jgi:hypothetical protein
MPLLVIHPKDNVGVALENLEKGDHVQGIDIQEHIKFAFKVALRTIHDGEEVLKYGEPIGVATEEISEGQMVHVHNMRSVRARGEMLDV